MGRTEGVGMPRPKKKKVKVLEAAEVTEAMNSINTMTEEAVPAPSVAPDDLPAPYFSGSFARRTRQGGNGRRDESILPEEGDGDERNGGQVDGEGEAGAAAFRREDGAPDQEEE